MFDFRFGCRGCREINQKRITESEQLEVQSSLDSVFIFDGPDRLELDNQTLVDNEIRPHISKRVTLERNRDDPLGFIWNTSFTETHLHGIMVDALRKTGTEVVPDSPSVRTDECSSHTRTSVYFFIKASVRMWWLLLLLAIVIIITIVFVPKKEQIKYYVIHLKGNKERHMNIKNMGKNLGRPIIEVDATTGASISDNEFSKVVSSSQFIYNKNELGCYKSHQRIISRLKYERCDYAVIFEDDFAIPPELHNKIQSIIEEFPVFDVLFIGIHQTDYKGLQMTNLVHGVEYDRKFTGSHAYIIKKSQSSKIEKFLRDITVPIDVKYYNMIRDGDIDGFVTFPNVVNVMNDLRSTLGHH